MQKLSSHTPHPAASGARPFRALLGLFALALVLAACSTTTTPPVPDFSLSFSGGGSGDGTVEIEQGTSLDVTVTVGKSGGFNGVVTLSSGVTTAQVPGIDVTFDPATTGSTSTMTISVDASVDFNSDYTLTVTGASGSINNRTATLTIDVTEATAPVGSIAVSAAPTSLTLVQDTDRDVTITITPDGGFSGDVDLSFDAAASGITGTFGTDSVTVNAAANSTLTLAADNTVTPGTYTLTVTGTAGTLTDSVDITVTVVAASSVKYVNADSGSDAGTGSAVDPLETIAQALTDLGGDGTIFLQPATASYDGGHTLTGTIVLEGTGASEGDATIAGTTGDGILIQGGTVTLRNLTIDGFNVGVRVNSGSNDLIIDGVTIDGAAADGFAVSTVGTSITIDATDLTLTGIGGDAMSLGNNGDTTGPSITATFTNLVISGGNGEGIDFKGSAALDVTLDNATISNVGDGGIELDSGVASGASFVMRNSTVTGSAGIGMVIQAFGAATIDIGDNNTIKDSGVIELSDQRANGDTTVIAAGGLTLQATDPSGTATGIASSAGLWEILGTGNQIDFGP